MSKVLVLVSTYNGEKFLQAQLDSLIAQKLPNNYELGILVRDDGSTDSTTKILEDYKSRGYLDWYTGKNLKPAKSFWDLVQNAPDAEYYCFCDQDDVWYEDKIARAVDSLNKENGEQPLLYCSNVMIADGDCNPIRPFIGDNGNYTDFAHSLIYSLAPGCTMVFNHSARCEFMKYDMNEEVEIIHDWLAHKISAMLGKFIYDPIPSMNYRQHGNNVIGVQKSGIVGFFKRVKRVLGKHASIRSLSAKSLINVYGERVDAEKLHLLEMVANYKTDKFLKKELFRMDVFKVDDPPFQNLMLKLAISLNKL